MKLFRIRGGVHVNDRKDLSSEQPIETLPLPQRLYVPVKQHNGAPADPVVKVGDRVLKGQVLARAQGSISATVHSPSSGEVICIGLQTAPHPSGLPERTVVIETDGQERWTDDLPPPIDDPFAESSRTIADRVAASGIVGLGGALFPTAVKLNVGTKTRIDTLVINGAECEPYLTCDDRLMREQTEAIVDGIRIMAHSLGVDRAFVAVEMNKPQALAAMTEAAKVADGLIRVVGIPARYPMGSERHLIQTLTGRETPARRLPGDVGVVVHNVATARAVHQAVRHGRPLISRVVTVSGGAVRRPRNVEAPIGTLVCELLDFCGGTKEMPARLLSGGPMMGQALHSLVVPMVKGTSGILALAQSELHQGAEQPCIRCGTCVEVCPCGLVPMELATLIRRDRLQPAADKGLADCVGCGTCAYACPSHIPLLQYFQYAKGKLRAMDRDRRKHELMKRLAAVRTARMERIAQAKKATMAARQAAAAAKKANTEGTVAGSQVV